MSSRRAKSIIAVVLGMTALSSVQAGDMNKGREIYDLHCVVCHGMDGYPVDMTIPSFANGDRLYLMDQQLMQSVSDGKNLMPAFRGLLTDDEIRDVITYLRTL